MLPFFQEKTKLNTQLEILAGRRGGHRLEMVQVVLSGKGVLSEMPLRKTQTVFCRQRNGTQFTQEIGEHLVDRLQGELHKSRGVA